MSILAVGDHNRRVVLIPSNQKGIAELRLLTGNGKDRGLLALIDASFNMHFPEDALRDKILSHWSRADLMSLIEHRIETVKIFFETKVL